MKIKRNYAAYSTSVLSDFFQNYNESFFSAKMASTFVGTPFEDFSPYFAVVLVLDSEIETVIR